MFRIITLFVALLALCAGDPALAAKKAKRAAKPVAAWELPMAFTLVRSADNCDPNCPEWISADGKVTPGTSKRFRAFLKTTGNRKLPVVLQSAGGDVQSALAMGRIIREEGLDAVVGWTSFESCAPKANCKPKNGVYRGRLQTRQAYCNSACPVILSGGVRRLAAADSTVGVHQVTTTWQSEKVFYRETYTIVNGKRKILSRKEVKRTKLKPKTTTGIHKALRVSLTDYYKDMGIDVGLIAEAEKTPASKITTLPVTSLKKFRLITASDNPRSLVDASLCRQPTPAANCRTTQPQT